MKMFMRKENNILVMSCVGLIILMITILYLYLAICFFHLNIREIALFLGILFLAVQLPGNIFLCLFRLHFKSSITKYPVGFFLGFAVISFVYYAALWMDCIAIIYFYLVAIICVGGWISAKFIIKRYKYTKPCHIGINFNHVFENIDLGFIIYIFVFFFASVIYLQFQQANIEYSQSTNIFHDLVWHMGIVNAISKDFFPICPWSGAGIELKYHFFCDLLYGIIMRISGISADVQILQCGSFLTAYLYTTSTYALFKELLNKNKMAALFAVMIIPATFVPTNLIEHILVNTNNVATAFSCLMCIIIIINTGLKDNVKIVSTSIILALFVYLLTGLKGPFGAVFLTALIGTCVFSFLFKTRKKNSVFIYTIMGTVSFVATYIIFLTGSTSKTTYGVQFVLGATMKYSFLSDIFYNFVESDGVDQYLKYIVLIVYVMIIMGACFLPFLFQFFKEIKNLWLRYKPINEMIILNCAVVIIGFTAWMLLNFDSNNQMYFAFASVPSLVFIATWYFTEERIGTVKRVICSITIILILFGGITVCKGVKYWVNKSIIEYRASQNGDYEEELHRFSYSEYQAMLWLRDNTEKEALIAGDRYSLSRIGGNYDTENRFNSRWFYYTAYSQRTFFLEGTGYGGVTGAKQRQELYEKNESLYDLKNKNRENLTKMLGIDYIVVSERIHPGLNLTSDKIEQCYVNRDIQIYKVSNNIPAD